jgi:hypothetical protein
MTKFPQPLIRFAAPHKRALYAVFVLLWLSGALWLAFHYFLRVPGEFGATAHPLEIWWLRLHGMMGFAALVALGSVLPVHARHAWRLKKNRASGLAMKSVLLWLAATGYALYYFASEANETWLPLLHWIAGLMLPMMIVLHIRHGRARPNVSQNPASAHAYAVHTPPASTTPFSAASQPIPGKHSERNINALPKLQTGAAGSADQPVVQRPGGILVR